MMPRKIESAGGGIYNSIGDQGENMKHSRLTVLVVLFALILSACSSKPSGKDPKNSEGSSESGTGTTVVLANKSTEPPEFSELIPESSPRETEPPKPLTDEEALSGFENYLYFKIKNLQKILDEDKVPCTWGIASSNKKEIMIMFRSNTGALLRYHINRNTGKTYVTQYAIQSNSYYRTRETLNIRDYLNRRPTPTPYVIKPKGKATPKPAQKTVVKVSAAVSKTSVISGKKYAYKIPKVSITGKNTDAVNKKMRNELGRYATRGSGAREIVYSYHITKRLVSILVRISDHGKDSRYGYKVYNISISSGKYVKDESVVKLAGSTNRKFKAAVKATFKKYKGGSSVPAAEAKKIIKTNLKRVSYRYVEPYVGKNGHLCFLGSVACHGGSGSATIPFDASKKRPY